MLESRDTTNLKHSLYTEHLECISMLYEQRMGILQNKRYKWLQVRDVEERMAPHIDALLLGGDDALGICIQLAAEGDFGELYAATAVLCKMNRYDLVEETIESLDATNVNRLNAVCNALCHELPESGQGDLLEKLSEKGACYLLIAARVAGYRRFDLASIFCSILQKVQVNKEVLLSVVHALGRIRKDNGNELLIDSLQNNDQEIVDACIYALIRIGKSQDIKRCLSIVPPCNWPGLALGLYGGRDALVHIVYPGNDHTGNRIKATEEHVLAAGIAGNIETVEDLISCLSDDSFAETAALALSLMTGADLQEEYFIPEVIDEETLFEHELEKFRQGELYPPGKEPGITISRISQNPEDWMEWWTANKINFDLEIRYRNGRPCSPECLFENIRSDKSPEIVRRLAAEELVIRYDIDIIFETDMAVSLQQDVIEHHMNFPGENRNRFEHGRWYAGGVLIDKNHMKQNTEEDKELTEQ